MSTPKTKKRRSASTFAFIALWSALGASAQSVERLPLSYDTSLDPLVFKHLNYGEAKYRRKVLIGALKEPYTLEIAERKGEPNGCTYLLLKGRSVENFEQVDYDLENPTELAPGRYIEKEKGIVPKTPLRYLK